MILVLFLKMNLLNITNTVYLLILKKSAKKIIKNKILKILKFIKSNNTFKLNKITNIVLNLLLPNLLLIYL